VALAIYRRFMRKSLRPPTSPMDCYALAIVALILISGVLLEASKIGSYSLYQDMVTAYVGREMRQRSVRWKPTGLKNSLWYPRCVRALRLGHTDTRQSLHEASLSSVIPIHDGHFWAIPLLKP